MQFTGETVGVFSGARRAMEEWWLLPRNLRGGTQAMRAMREDYLPRYNIETKDQSLYEKRLKRARLFPAYDRAVCDLGSMPFQKAPKLTDRNLLDPRLQVIEENADRSGTSLWSFMLQTHCDAIDRGMALFMVDNVPTNGVSMLEAEQQDIRPYFARIHPDNFVGAVVETRSGVERIVDLRVREWATVTTAEGIERSVQRIRHWDETMVELWEQDYGNTTPTASGLVQRDGYLPSEGFRLIEAPRPHGFVGGIPLVVHYTNRLDPLLARPPLEELAWENVAHWQCRSEQDAALTSGRFPILRGKGLSREVAEAKPLVGPGTTVTDTSADADWAFVEISGASIAAGEKQLDRIEANMAWMAMQPLVQANGPAGPSTATGEVRADVREKATAQKWAEGLEWSFYRAFQHAARWIGTVLPDTFDIELWRDFAILGPSAQQDVVNMQADVQNGRLTLETYLQELKRRGKLAETWDPVEEASLLEQDAAKRQEAQMQQVIAQIQQERQHGNGQQQQSQADQDTPAAAP